MAPFPHPGTGEIPGSMLDCHLLNPRSTRFLSGMLQCFANAPSCWGDAPFGNNGNSRDMWDGFPFSVHLHQGIICPTVSAPVLVDAPPGAFSDFAVHTFSRCPAARVLLLNLHPQDIPALGVALQGAATAGVGTGMTYWVKPEDDGTVRLLGQKPDRDDLEAGWRRVALVHRYRPMRDVPGPLLTLPSGGMWSWSAHTLGVTTGNMYVGPQILFPTACPRPLIGFTEHMHQWE